MCVLKKRMSVLSGLACINKFTCDKEREFKYCMKRSRVHTNIYAQNDTILKKLVRNFKLIEHGGIRCIVIWFCKLFRIAYS